jgi:hypothetical protein
LLDKTIQQLTIVTALILSGCSVSQPPKIELPDGSGLLLVDAQQSHAYLPEYKYHVAVRLPDKRTVEIDLEAQSGGHPQVVMTWYPGIAKSGPFVAFKHMIAADVPCNEILDLHTGKKFIAEGKNESRWVNVAGRILLGEIGYDLAFHSEVENGLQVEMDADCLLDCFKLDDIEIARPNIPDFYRRADLRKVLNNQKVRRLLVVRLNPTVTGMGTAFTKQTIEELQPSIAELGFQRIVFLREDHYSPTVLKDTKVN